VVAFYFLLPARSRWVLLLVASYYFYMCWNYKYVVLIFITTLLSYLASIGIYKSKNKKIRIALLASNAVVVLGILFFFKYFNFFGEAVNSIFAQFNVFTDIPAYNYLLPVGISFYTFQTLSYTIDIYRKAITPEYHFGRFALFVSFFPQLVAGPIERASNLLPQFSRSYDFDYNRIRDGVVLMAWGFFKKVVIADRLSEYVNLVYNNPEGYYGLAVVLATLFFAFQIYCDFSGYSDIAIGSAKILGFTLMTNFRRPYFALNIREFWQRWHISLSSWFRDYLYISLGGNRVSIARWQFNLFFTFLVSGIWHGANWTFIIWGALHGFYLVFAIWTKNLRIRTNKLLGLESNIKLNNAISVLLTFALVCFAWIFFRANSVSEAFVIIKHMFVFSSANINLFYFPVELYIAIASILVLVGIEYWLEFPKSLEKIYSLKWPYKWAIMSCILFSILILGKWDSVDFLYFQF
jgi:D-alanyl-lipoteichoic acid acyltransferase DltB (MBOAT superfamily)